MAKPIRPDEPTNDYDVGGNYDDPTYSPPTTPGNSGYVPPPAPGSGLSIVTQNSNFTFTADQITGAGGPWASYNVRVTPINDYGVGPYAELDNSDIRVTETNDMRVTENDNFRNDE